MILRIIKRYIKRLSCSLFWGCQGIGLIYASVHIGYFATTPLALKKDLVFHIQPNTTIYHLIANLMDQGVLKNPRLFLILAYLKNAFNNLQAGEYQLEVGVSPNECLTRFKKGKVKLYRFTLVEGWTYKELFEVLKKDKRFKNTLNNDFLKKLHSEISFSVGTLEGLFFPESYDFPCNTPNTEILRRAFSVMQQQLNIAWEKRAPDLPWKNPYEALIAASLVERETAFSDERPKIAGVIVRRLQKKIPLQIDASVIYGLGKYHKGPLKKYELKIDTRYNTYKRKGLPPTPIAIPSLNAIEAVLHPDLENNYLYFVVKSDGQHAFSETLETHHLAVRHYRKAQRARRV